MIAVASGLGPAARFARRVACGIDVILEVFVVFVAAKLAAELFVRLTLPAIAGELLVGVVLGPHALGVVRITSSARTLADLGIVVLLFAVGLETPLTGLVAVGRAALLTSLAGIAAAVATGALVVLAFGHGFAEGLFVGTALAASSVGVAARVFQDLGLVATRPAQIVIGAAVVDDVVTLALFPLVQGLGPHRASGGNVVVGLIGAVAFVVLVAVLGSWFARRHATLLERPRAGRGPFVVALAFCLGLAALAERVGLAALVGAFLAGMVLAETTEHYDLDRRMQPLVDFLVPFFFVVAGASMRPALIARGGVGFAVALAFVTVAAKLLGCGLGALGRPWRERLEVGAGMVPRNEVTLVVATAGLAAGALDPAVFSVVVGAVIVTTLLAPALLRVAIPGASRIARRRAGGPPEAAGPAPGREDP